MTQPRIGVGCIVRRGSDLLLIHRRGAHGEGTWSTPGGNLDFVDGKHYVTLWFEAEHVRGEAYVRADDELSEVAWFPKDDLPEPLFLPLRNLLDGRKIG